MGALAVARVSLADYLAAEDVAEFRSEYWDGEVFPLIVNSFSHSVVTVNLGRRLASHLDGRDCAVGASTARVRGTASRFVYPDLLVVCGKVSYSVEDPQSVTNPKVIVEVLYPSTQGNDYIMKSLMYRSLPSLEEYAMVWQDTPRVELLRRDADGSWKLITVEGLDATMTFASLGISIPLSEIYAGVTLNSDRTEETRPRSPRRTRGSTRR